MKSHFLPLARKILSHTLLHIHYFRHFSVSPRSEELVVATSDGLLQRVRWNGEMNISLTLSVRELPFSTDLATTSGM